MQKSNIAANTQVTDVDIAYLAGLWDGEGHMSVVKHQRRKGKWDYRPACGLVNTNEDLISRVIEILDGLGISARLESRQIKKPYHKRSYQIAISRLDAIKKLAETLIPYLCGKKAVAKLTLRFVNSRLKHDKRNHPVTDDEISLYEQMKKLNQKGTSETIRGTELSWETDPKKLMLKLRNADLPTFEVRNNELSLVDKLNLEDMARSV